MSLNTPSYSEIAESITTHDSLESVASHILELIKFSCVDLILVTEENWWLYPSRHHKNEYRVWHPWYERTQKILETHKIDFSVQIQEKISERRAKVFKNGLHLKQKESPITLEILPPTTSRLEQIDTGEIEWAMRFSVDQHLTPRWIKDGDKGQYPLIFEVYVSQLGYESHILKSNAVLNTSNRQYKGWVISPKKIEPTTQERDASITRSRDAYRTRLQNVLRLERKSWQKK